MFIIDKKKIEMIEGDFGIDLPITIELEGSESISQADIFRLSIFKGINKEPLIQKSYSLNENNTFNFNLTEEESSLLKVGYYRYDLDWYSREQFMNNVVAKEIFQVTEKAGIVNED